MLQRGRKSAQSLAMLDIVTGRADDPPETLPRTPPPAPTHLSPEMAAWWVQLTTLYEFEAHSLTVLEACAAAWDRYVEARQQIAAEGPTIIDNKGALRAHPAIGIERDARAAFARLVKDLGLETEPTVPALRKPWESRRTPEWPI